MIEYPTSYKGALSERLGVVQVNGEPRSANNQENSTHAVNLNKWKVLIRQEIQRMLPAQFSGYKINNLIPHEKGEECNLYIVFRLLDDDQPAPKGIGRKTINPYRNKDVDNLTKAAADAIISSRCLIRDDKLIKGIKVFKEPVFKKEDQGLSFQCIPTKTFTITRVERVAGDVFMPHWVHGMQYITAVDEEEREGIFIDNLEGRLFIPSPYNPNKRYYDAVPGYKWWANKGKTLTGCMVFKRTHVFRPLDPPNSFYRMAANVTPQAKEVKKTFFWLHKWAWW